MFRRTVRVLLTSTLSMSSVLFVAGALPALADDVGGETPTSTVDVPADSGDSGTPLAEEVTEQSVTITDVAIAVADTGNNQIVDPPADETSADESPADEAPADEAPADEAPADEAPADETTADEAAVPSGSGAPVVVAGPATAVGSQDTTTVSQQAAAVLTGNASADITQVVFVFNIGLAGATSGGNTAGGAASGGDISTGSATAVGNSGTTYITQAGAADATGGQSDSTVQISVTVSLGVAVANSGVNDTSGSAPGSAQVGTGGATSTGNDSVTDITQVANAIGSDSAQIVIGQQAVVVNIGVSLANSGYNGTADLAAALAGGADSTVANQLFAALLPALLGSYAANGADAVNSGTATATGNNTSTYISQTATATASGDGSVNVQQDVSVGNVGVAVANTGLNDTGATMTPATLDASSQAIVSQLAEYLSALFASVNSWEPGDPPPSVPTMTLTNGSVNLDVGSSITGTQTDFGSTDPAADGPRGTIRQIVAVFTIALSSADSGSNTAIDVGVTDDGSLVVAPAGSITTGDAVAVNDGTTIVCQRANEPDAPCLGPPIAVSPPVPVVSPAAAVSSGSLPVTGADTDLLLMLALAMVMAGSALTVLVRRSALR